MYLAVDIGGTKVLMAVFNEAGEILSSRRFDTPKTYSEFIKNFESELTKFKVKDFKATGVAIPGRVDRKHGIGVRFGNLTWENVPIEADVERITNAPTVLENDAKAGALAEALSIKKYKRVLFVTVGTGIGIALVENGINNLDVDDGGGHGLMIEYRGKLKVWEEFASGKAIVRRYGKKARDITDPETWQAIAEDLSIGIINLVAHYQPDVIVIGGGVGSHFEHFGKKLTDSLKKYETPLMPIPPLKKAKWPEEAVIYGSYELAKAKYG